MTPFMEYYAGLAPPDETMLVVKQAPRRSGNGYTFPAYLPERWKPGVAFYGNIGSYIVERLKGGIHASAKNIEHVALLVCDDVGSKSKTPPIEPTWKMTTSPGNQQWAFVFALDNQPKKAEYCAAYKAIADAGYSDPGAGNAVRNFRLEGSINLKPGRENFAAVLDEFHPEREFTLPQLLEAFAVTPGEADSGARVDPMLIDDGNDEVLKWLTDSGHVLSPVNGAGWLSVVCPNAAAHTDGAAEGRYMPSTRAYTCLHQHCTAWDSEAYLEWVELSGGPSVQAGLRSDLLATTMARVLAKLAPTEAYPDATGEILAEVKARQLGREEKNDLHARWAFVSSDDSYFDMQERNDVSRGVFSAIYRHLDCKPNAAQWFDGHRSKREGFILSGVTYAPGEDALCAHDGRVYGNRWRDARPDTPRSAAAVDVSPWLAHCRHLVPEPSELAHILNALAFKLQQPRVKINHALLHASVPGAGKDTMYAPFFYALGGAHKRNIELVSSDMLSSQFQHYLEAELILINELRQAEGADRRALENRLKPVIAAPPEYLSCNRKGLAPISVVNRSLVMAFSNFRDAIALPSNDRRWHVVWSDAGMMPESAARAIWAWYAGGGFDAVAQWLLARDVSAWNPAAPPAHTPAFELLCEQSLSSAESFLMEAIRVSPEFASGVIGGPFHGLLDRLGGSAPAGLKLVPNALFHALAEAGWRDCGRVRAADSPLRRVFCRPDLAGLSKSDLYRLAGERPAPVLSLVPDVKKPA